MMWLAFAGSLSGIALYLVSAYRFDQRNPVTPLVQDEEHDDSTATTG